MKFFISFFLCSLLAALGVLVSIPAYAQQPVLRPDTAKSSVIDTLQPSQTNDTLQTSQTDTLTKKSAPASGLNSEVKYTAEDSIRVDRVTNMVYLYGKGRIIYEDIELDADYIRLDQKNNLVFAKGFTNPKNNRYSGKPIFKQGAEPPITTDSLVFNFNTKKGKSYGVFSDVEGGYLQARQFKKNEYNEGFIKNAIFSTCNLPHPHFGIHISKGIVTDKQIITGPAYLVIEDVPLPAAVPFGFFPKPNNRVSGLLFPSFGEDAAQGFFMRDLGYYIGLNDYWDLAVYGTLFSKGNYQARTSSRYRKNYKYDGSINLNYGFTRLGVEGTTQYKNPTKDFRIQWSHSQSAQANPGTTFSASVNAGTSSYAQNTAAGGSYDLDEITRNSLQSSISYGKVFGNGLFNLTSSLGHSQDLLARTVRLSLPEFSLNMSSLNPFDSKDRVGEQKWYQRINVGYSLQGSNSIETKDSLLFRKESLKDFRNGMQHNIPINLSLNVLKFFQFNSGIQYNERWYLQTVRKRFGPVPSGTGSVIDTVQGFSRAYEYSLNSGFSTKFYGQKNFKKGKLVALRHVITPSASFNYRPDFGKEKFGYYRDIVGDTSTNAQQYSIYESGLYGSPSRGRQAAISFSVDNNIEAKVRSKSDSTNTFEKIPIIQGLSFNGSYNFAQDSLQLSSISFSGRTAFFKQKLGINFNGSFDPYQIDKNGRQINQFLINDGKLARLTNFGLSTDFSFNSTAFKTRNQTANQVPGQTLQTATPLQEEELAMINRNPNAFVDFNIPWNISASYSFNYSKAGLEAFITNTVNFSGDLNVTPKWKVQYTSGYDFRANKLTLPQFSIYRDLHCWDLSFRWIPIGQYRSYSVDLRVKASVLQDLKLSRRRDFQNNF